MLSVLVFLPLAGALVVLLLKQDGHIRMWAALVTIAELALAIVAFVMFRTGDYAKEGNMELVERYEDWIPALNIQYHLGVDGLSMPLVLLTALLGMCAVFASWHGIRDQVKEYFMWLLLLQTAVMGVFVSLDLILFFIFWELELLPMYFLISKWGSGRRQYSAMKFLVFTFMGSAFMFVGILTLYFSVGTFNIVELPSAVDGARLLIPAVSIFSLLIIAFAVKLPVWPVHTWLPDAHTDAPTAVSVMLAGVLLKMGGYGMIRIAVGIFPGTAQEYAWLLATLAVISVLYGAVVTLRQTDLKRLIAFSSISHMGYVLLGISSVVGVSGTVSPVGLNGAAMQMFTHGTITGLLFLHGGHGVRQGAHTTHSRHERTCQPNAHNCSRVRHSRTGFAWPAWHQRFRLRNSDIPGHLPGVGLVNYAGSPGHRHYCRVHPVDAAAGILRAADPAVRRHRGRHAGGDDPYGCPGDSHLGSRHLPGRAH